MNTNKHTAGLVDLASFQHLELKHCHLVLCSVYFWTHRWSFAIFRCTVKVDETLGQRLMFTLLNVLMSRLLRVETLRVSSGRASQDTLSLWTTVSKKKKNTLFSRLTVALLGCFEDHQRWSETFFIVLSLHHQEQQETVIVVAAFFLNFFLKEMFLYQQQGNFLCLYSVFKNRRAFVQGKHFCAGLSSRVFTCTKRITEMKLNLLSRIEHSSDDLSRAERTPSSLYTTVLCTGVTEYL